MTIEDQKKLEEMRDEAIREHRAHQDFLEEMEKLEQQRMVMLFQSKRIGGMLATVGVLVILILLMRGVVNV